MTDVLNEGKLGHSKSGITVLYETLIKNIYCNIHNKTVGVGKVGWIYFTSSLCPSQCNSWQKTENNHRAGHIGSWSEALRGCSLWLWVPSCRERLLGLKAFVMGEQVEEEETDILRYRGCLIQGEMQRILNRLIVAYRCSTEIIFF